MKKFLAPIAAIAFVALASFTTKGGSCLDDALLELEAANSCYDIKITQSNYWECMDPSEQAIFEAEAYDYAVMKGFGPC